MSLFEEEAEADYDEVLPFALHEPATQEMKPLHVQFEQPKLLECSETRSTVVQSAGIDLIMQSAMSQPPPLMSSMMSCQTTDSSLASSVSRSAMSEIANNGHSQWGGATTGTEMLSSQQLDAAASLMASLAENGLQMTLTSEQMHVSRTELGHSQQSRPTTTHSQSYSRLGFSRLMQNAGDTTDFSISRVQDRALPVLREEVEADSFHSAREGPVSQQSFPSNISSTTSQLMSADWIPVDGPSSSLGYMPPILEPSSGEGRARMLRRQTLAGNAGVSARQLDPTSFEVSIQVAPDLSVEHIMEVLGNPSHLALWCDSIRSLVVTNSSDGASEQREASSQRRAIHEGEWIEATTTDLISPPSTSSCFYKTRSAMWDLVGFPSNYGDVSMFVERQQGRLGLSLGPFAGDVTASHSIRVDKRTGATRIVNRVTLSKDVSNSILLCGVLDCLESCFLPSLKGYMSQTVSSMMRLRVLAETGEGGHQEGFQVINSRRQLIS